MQCIPVSRSIINNGVLVEEVAEPSEKAGSGPVLGFVHDIPEFFGLERSSRSTETLRNDTCMTLHERGCRHLQRAKDEGDLDNREYQLRAALSCELTAMDLYLRNFGSEASSLSKNIEYLIAIIATNKSAS